MAESLMDEEAIGFLTQYNKLQAQELKAAEKRRQAQIMSAMGESEIAASMMNAASRLGTPKGGVSSQDMLGMLLKGVETASDEGVDIPEWVWSVLPAGMKGLYGARAKAKAAEKAPERQARQDVQTAIEAESARTIGTALERGDITGQRQPILAGTSQLPHEEVTPEIKARARMQATEQITSAFPTSGALAVGAPIFKAVTERQAEQKKLTPLQSSILQVQESAAKEGRRVTTEPRPNTVEVPLGDTTLYVDPPKINFGTDFNEYFRGLYKGDPNDAPPEVIAQVTKKMIDDKMRISAAQGAQAAAINRQTALSAPLLLADKDANPEQFRNPQTGQSITGGESIGQISDALGKKQMVWVSDDQNKLFNEMEDMIGTVGRLRDLTKQVYSDRGVLANTDPQGRLTNAGKALVARLFQTNKDYNLLARNIEGLPERIGRPFTGAKGVQTNDDVGRMSSLMASVTGIPDSAELALGLWDELLGTAQRVQGRVLRNENYQHPGVQSRVGTMPQPSVPPPPAKAPIQAPSPTPFSDTAQRFMDRFYQQQRPVR